MLKLTGVKIYGIILIVAGFIVLPLLYFQLSFSAILNLLSKDYLNVEWMGTTREKEVALTFDDGPDPVYTTQILRILAEDHIIATFFVEGKNAKLHPDLIKTEINAGHEIGNHTYNHPHLQKISAAAVNREIEATDRQLKKISGKIPYTFRPPYLELDQNILESSRKLHKKIIMSTLTLEHSAAASSAAEADRVIKHVFPGAIILAHDGRLNRSKTVAALPFLIKGLLKKGYRFVTVDELF